GLLRNLEATIQIAAVLRIDSRPVESSKAGGSLQPEFAVPLATAIPQKSAAKRQPLRVAPSANWHICPIVVLVSTVPGRWVDLLKMNAHVNGQVRVCGRIAHIGIKICVKNSHTILTPLNERTKFEVH